MSTILNSRRSTRNKTAPRGRKFANLKTEMRSGSSVIREAQKLNAADRAKVVGKVALLAIKKNKRALKELERH